MSTSTKVYDIEPRLKPLHLRSYRQGLENAQAIQDDAYLLRYFILRLLREYNPLRDLSKVQIRVSRNGEVWTEDVDVVYLW